MAGWPDGGLDGWRFYWMAGWPDGGLGGTGCPEGDREGRRVNL
jgi:hypothetical protein